MANKVVKFIGNLGFKAIMIFLVFVFAAFGSMIPEDFIAGMIFVGVALFIANLILKIERKKQVINKKTADYRLSVYAFSAFAGIVIRLKELPGALMVMIAVAMCFYNPVKKTVSGYAYKREIDYDSHNTTKPAINVGSFIKPKENVVEKVINEPVEETKYFGATETHASQNDVSNPLPVQEQNVEPALEENTGTQLPDFSILEQSSTIDREVFKSAKEKGERVADLLNTFAVKCDLMGVEVNDTFTCVTVSFGSKNDLKNPVEIQEAIVRELQADRVYVNPTGGDNNALQVLIPNTDGIVHLSKLVGNIEDNSLQYALGENYSGNPVIGDLNINGHLLIGGNMISGKSTLVRTIISSMMMKNTPDTLRLLFIDSKLLNYSDFEGVPHLCSPIVQRDIDKIKSALSVVDTIRENRLNLLASKGCKNINLYNSREKNKLQNMVVVLDELDEIMSYGDKDVESLLMKIASTGAITGIHMIAVSKGADRNTIPATIRAGFNGRISFATSTYVQSRINLETTGAELLSRIGEIIYKETVSSIGTRVIIPDYETADVKTICNYWKAKGRPQYYDAFIEKEIYDYTGPFKSMDPIYEEVKKLVATTGKASTSSIQRYFGIGYNRAARIIDSLEQEGAIGPARGDKPRVVYITERDL